MSCNPQAARDDMLKGIKLLIDTDHFALVRHLLCKRKDGKTKYYRIRMVLNFDKTAILHNVKRAIFQVWNSLSVSNVTLDAACSSLGLITHTACILVQIGKVSRDVQ